MDYDFDVMFEEEQSTDLLERFNENHLVLFKELAELKREKKAIEEAEKQAMLTIEKAMSENGIKSLDNQFVRLTYVEPTESVKLDESRLRAEKPATYEQLMNLYNKRVKRKGYVKVTIK